jgi:hypothetical protein
MEIKLAFEKLCSFIYKYHVDYASFSTNSLGRFKSLNVDTYNILKNINVIPVAIIKNNIMERIVICLGAYIKYIKNPE